MSCRDGAAHWLGISQALSRPEQKWQMSASQARVSANERARERTSQGRSDEKAKSVRLVFGLRGYPRSHLQTRSRPVGAPARKAGRGGSELSCRGEADRVTADRRTSTSMPSFFLNSMAAMIPETLRQPSLCDELADSGTRSTARMKAPSPSADDGYAHARLRHVGGTTDEYQTGIN